MLAEDSSSRALKLVYDRYHADIEKHIKYYLGARDGSRAVLSDVFLAIWDQREQLAVIDSPVGWIMRVVRNKSFDYIKRNGTHNTVPLGPGFEATENSSPTSQLEFRQMQEQIRKIAEKHLTEKEREIFLLNKFQEYTPAEIATLKERPVQTIKNVLSSALSKIRKRIQDDLRSLVL